MRMSAKAALETVDIETRDRLVMEHVGLVKALASRLAHRIPAQVELSELISVGVLGLIDAAGRYRPSLGVPFDAFARRRIHGAMLDALRELDWAPRSLRKMRRRVDSTVAQLRHDLKREPKEEEIATALDISETEYGKVLDQLRSADLALIKRTSADGRDELEVAVDPDEGPHAHLERSELRALLAEAITELPERERQILALYYHEELTLAEIGQVIGVGESRVSQLRTQAIGRLRVSLGISLKQRRGTAH
ncbi:MAG: sigma-70 family RNA polymerase sigma factor [Vicinamibacterales bacterium]